MAPRSVIVDGTEYQLRRNVSREGNRWRVQISRRSGTGHSVMRQSFRDSEHGGVAGALDAAHRWIDEQDVREPYSRIDLSRRKTRKLTLIRRLKASRRGGKKQPFFWIEITPSKSKWRRGWMRIYLGSQATVDQARIDEAIVALHARWKAYRDHEVTFGRDSALEAKFEDTPVTRKAEEAAARTQLQLEDLLAWNGRGRGISFSPADIVDPARSEPYSPEEEAPASGAADMESERPRCVAVGPTWAPMHSRPAGDAPRYP